MHETLRAMTRMDRVQAPIIPVIGRMIRQVPGTISLGQGVVHYGPPRETLEAVRAALGRTATHEYHDGAGLPALHERIARKLRAAYLETGQHARAVEIQKEHSLDT